MIEPVTGHDVWNTGMTHQGKRKKPDVEMKKSDTSNRKDEESEMPRKQVLGKGRYCY